MTAGPEPGRPPASAGRRPGRKLSLSLAVAAAVVAADQLTKAWALDRLDGGREIHVVWTLRLRLTFNTGMAFSGGRGLGPVIGVVALVVIVGLLVSLRRGGAGGWVGAVALGLVVGGAVGNVADRVFRGDNGFLRGAVVDFIDLQWWPVFNVADAAITVGGVLLVLTSLLTERSPAPAAAAPPAGER